MTTAILHCHLFKNAGTSLDSILSRNFPGKWIEREFTGPPKLRRPKITSWLNDNPQCIAFSSHTCIGPLDQDLNRELLLITNYRHPIDRLRSSYSFERTQGTDNFGAVLASETSFRGYIKSRLALSKIANHFFCVNWQSRYFASFAQYGRVKNGISDDELLDLAKIGVKKFFHIGLVNKMDASNEQLEQKLKRQFAFFTTSNDHLNVTSSAKKSLCERIEAVKTELGDSVYNDLLEANKVDLALFDVLEKMLDLRTS